MSRIGAVILAAGASSRMGRSKALLEYHGETFLGRLVRLFAVYCEDVIVVAANTELCAPGARTVVNPAPERGMLSSLQCGLRAVHPGVDAALFTPVDIPAVEGSTVQRLVRGWSGELFRIPRSAGRRGHPVLAARPAIDELLALAPESEARTVVRRHEADIVYVDVDDPGILADIDTPADYERLR